MKAAKIEYKFYFLMCLFIFFLQQKVNSQIVIGTPSLSFSQACANATFNNYSTTFVFSPASGLNASNQFSIELSDASGSFTSSTVVFTSNSGAVTTSPATLNFSLPNTTAGENYKIRIKSSAPASTSSSSSSFAAYYKVQDSPFTINNLVSTGVFCTGGSYLLSIDNPGSSTNDSPLNYPLLTFKWYKETSATTSVFVANGSTLTVNLVGTYFVETNYGSCTSSSFSNRVTITEATSGAVVTNISSSLGSPFCPDLGPTVLSTISGNSYQWFKDGISIAGETNQMYETTESGTYSVQVDLGSCSASATITLISELFQSTINVNSTNTIEAGDTLPVIISNTANSPQFEWYLDNVLISGATVDNFIATDFGNYKVVVTETIGCIASREFLFEIIEAINLFPEVENIPNLISPNGDNINDTWIIPTKYVTGTNTEVTILSNSGEIVLQTNEYLNNWPVNNLNLTSINKVFYYVIKTQNNELKKGSITIIK